MAKESEKNTCMTQLTIVDELAKPGGSIEYIGEEERHDIKNLPAVEKDEIRKVGEKVIAAKLLEMDNLIIEAAVANLKNAMHSMEPANILLAKHARNLLDEQKKQFMRLTSNEENILSPINLDFLENKNIKAKNIKVEIKNTQINNGQIKKKSKMNEKPTETKEDRSEDIKRLYLEGKSTREISMILGIPKSTVGRILQKVT